MQNVCVLIPAAGAATRMRGADKLLEVVDGVPLLVRQVCIAQSAGLNVLVTLRADRPLRGAAIAGLDVDIQTIDAPDEGIAASIRAGAVWARARGAALMVLLADLPDITASDITTMAQAAHNHDGQIVQATASDGTPGHPVVWPWSALPQLALVRGDSGGRHIIAQSGLPIHRVALPGRAAVTDLDTPEAWAVWRDARDPLP